MAAYPPGPSRLFQLPDLAGGQAPGDLAYLVDVSLGTSPGDPSDVKSTLNDIFAELTKNITERTTQFTSSDGVRTVSSANSGKIGYSESVQSWVVSENGGAYQNLIKGLGVNQRVAFWTDTDTLSNDSAYVWDSINDRLGIGVTVAASVAPLNVRADSNSVAQQWFPESLVATPRIQMQVNNSEGVLGTSTLHRFHLMTNNLIRMTVEDAGTVGINQQVPAAQLHVVSSAAGGIGLVVASAPSPSANIVEFRNDASNRYQFGADGTLIMGLAGASGATGQLTFAVNGQTFTQTLRAGDTPAASNTYKWPSANPTASQALTASAPSGGVVTLSWTSVVTGPASPVNSVQFNDAGAFGGDSAFLWDKTNDRLLLGVSVVNGAAPLDILADSGTVATQWRPNSGTPRAQMQVNNSEAIVGTSTLHRFHLMSNNLIRMTVEDTGAIGINQQVPAAQLHVVAAAAGSLSLIVATAPSTSANIAEFRNDSSNRFVFGNSGILTLGLASTATGQLTFAVSGSANTQTLSGGTAPAATNTFRWPNADPTVGQVLTASAPAAGVVTLSWSTASGGATINATDTVMPYRSNSTTFTDSQLIRLSSAITELRNITTGTTAQSFYIYGTAANNNASAPTEYIRGALVGSSTAISLTAQIATPSTTAVAGIDLNLTASAAVAGASVAGAAAGGNVTITANNAARLTSGDANGGNVNLVFGTGIGTGRGGILTLGGTTTSFTGLVTTDVFGSKFVTAKLGNNTTTNAGFVGSILRIMSTEGNTNTVTADYGANILLSSGGLITWNSAVALNAGAVDTGLARPSAAVIRSTNGSTGLGSILIGNSTDSLTGNFTVMSSNAATNSVVTVARLGVNSTGTAADGFGAALSWSAETSTTNDTQTGLTSVWWTTATHASRTSAFSFTLVNNATTTEALRVSTPQNTPASPFVLSVYDGTAPNVWTSGTFAAKLYLTTPTLRPAGVVAHFSATGGDSPAWQFLRGRGTNASPTAIQNSDGIGDLEWWGQTSTATNNVVAGARIRVSATENWSAGNNGCQMIFFTANNAGTITDRAYLKETGTFRIGATAGSYNTTTLLQIGGYASWNTDVVGAIYSGANGTKALEIIGTSGQTANLLRIFRDSLTPDLMTVAASGVLSLRAGLNTGTTVARVGGTIHENFTPVSNSGTGETNLMSYSVPANTLGTDNDYLEVTAWGEFTAAASNKTVKMYFGSTVIFTTGALAFGASAWRLEARIVRGSSTTQVTITVFSGNTTLLATTAQVAAPGETMSGAVTLKCTGQSSVASDEVFQEGFIVKWNPASN